MLRPVIIRDEASRARAIELIGKLDLLKPWAVTVAKAKSKRSIDQNNLYWLWLGIIANETGNTATDIHEWCKGEFLPPVFVEVNGKVREARRSTTDLNTADMTTYLDRINAWAASDLGIILPHPDDRGRTA